MLDIFLSIVMIIFGGGLLIFVMTVIFGAPYVPTHTSQLKKLFAKLKFNQKEDVLIDLGFGDGKVLLEASPQVKQAIGYEINPILWLTAKIRLRKINNINLKLTDFRRSKIPPETSIVYVFSAEIFKAQIVEMIQKHIEKTGLVVTLISYGFEFEEFGAAEIYEGFCIYRISP